VTDEELIAGYVAYVESVDDDSDFWAWEAVTDLTQTDPERAWRVLLESLRRCGASQVHIIGCGPLEDLMIQWPRLLATRAADEIARNESFKTAFNMIRFSLDYASHADAEHFNSILRQQGVDESLIPQWGPAVDESES
jgi:hypothetical protein